MKVKEFKRWLASKGCSFKEGKAHTKVFYKTKQTILTRSSGEINEYTRQGIIKQLGIE